MHHYLTIKKSALDRALNRLYKAMRLSFDKDRAPEDPTLKRYEIHERLIERGLKHPDTVSEVRELIRGGFLPPDGLN